MHENLRITRMQSAADTPNIDSAGAVSEFLVEGPALLKRVGIIVTTAVNPDNAVALTLALSRRPTPGSSSGEVNIGTFRVMAANAANLAVGSVVYKDLHIDDADGEVAEDGTTRFEAPSSNLTAYLTAKNPFIIPPGQTFAMTLEASAEADSGAVVSFVEYVQLPIMSDSVIATATVSRDVTQDVGPTP